MAGYNISLYLDNEKSWEMFKEACKKEGKKPNSLLRSFIEKYYQEVLGIEPDLEHQIAKAMIESKKIVSGEIQAKKAADLLKELNQNHLEEE
jgi:hypothetical protein